MLVIRLRNRSQSNEPLLAVSNLAGLNQTIAVGETARLTLQPGEVIIFGSLPDMQNASAFTNPQDAQDMRELSDSVAARDRDIAVLREQLASAENDLEHAGKQVTELTTQLNESQANHTLTQTERDALKAELAAVTHDDEGSHPRGKKKG